MFQVMDLEDISLNKIWSFSKSTSAIVHMKLAYVKDVDYLQREVWLQEQFFLYGGTRLFGSTICVSIRNCTSYMIKLCRKPYTLYGRATMPKISIKNYTSYMIKLCCKPYTLYCRETMSEIQQRGIIYIGLCLLNMYEGILLDLYI